MRIYAGVEQDTLASAELKRRNRYAFDYVIGSAHYLPFLIDGVHPAVDGDLALLQRVVRECYEGDANELAQTYYGLHASGVEQDRPDIIGHFDLVRKYADAIGLDTSHPRYRQIALAALERVRATDAVLEVNTGAIARGYLQTPYPEPFLLEAWRDLGGEVTLTSDCHQADQLDCAFAQTEQTLRELGFKRLLRLGTGAAFWEESPL